MLQINVGDKFGKLSVVKELEKLILPSGQTNRVILCKCDCGNEKKIRLLHLVRGRIKTCGCSSEKHSQSKTRLYRTWRSMKERCYLSPYKDSHRYKGRGIYVCKEWLDSFICFKNWALNNGYLDNLQIDRINNNGNYEPNNCKFVLNIENVNNRDYTFKVNYENKEFAFMDLMRIKNIEKQNIQTIRARIKRGWDHSKAVNTPIRE